MGATVASDVQDEEVEDLIEETERLYEHYLSISMVADLSQLGQEVGPGQAAVYGGPAPVGLVVTNS